MSTRRLTLREGVFNRTLEEIELYRIKDTTMTRGLWERMLGRQIEKLRTLARRFRGLRRE